ncbi:hypothetical protein [Haliangium sp.]|uniref:hypothetical protein n=1 Tax=Haliangium sp. TaxID=2663208 RepID=UPI003D0EEB58
MADFTIHLGCRWDATQTGSQLIDEIPDDDPRVLQFAASDSNGNPAWFNFGTGVEVAVYLWDLSTEVEPGAKSVSLSFGVLDDSQRGTLDPSTVVSSGDGRTVYANQILGSPIIDSSAQVYLFDSVTLDKNADLDTCPWANPVAGYTVGNMTLTDTDQSIELTFIVQVTYDAVRRNYIGDPECIVGRGGDPR